MAALGKIRKAWDRQYKRTIIGDYDEEVVYFEAVWVKQVRNLKQMNKEKRNQYERERKKVLRHSKKTEPSKPKFLFIINFGTKQHSRRRFFSPPNNKQHSIY